MPLFINDVKIDVTRLRSVPRLISFLDAEESLKRTREQFLAEKKTLTQSAESPIVVALQGERCAVFRGQCKYVLSEEATTCQIVALRDRTSGATSLTHLDGFSDEKTFATLDAMICDVLDRDARSTVECTDDDDDCDAEIDRDRVFSKQREHPIDLYLQGGYDDERRLSIVLLHKLVYYFATSAFNFNIVLWCAVHW